DNDRLLQATHRAGKRNNQMKRTILITAIILLAIVVTVIAQPRSAVDFQLLKINTNFISSPQFTYTGAEQFQADQRERWLEVEVTFACAPESTDELTLKYFILFNGKLLIGEVTHVNIPAGRENRSVMYVTPKTLQRLMLGRTVTNNALQNTKCSISWLERFWDLELEISLEFWVWDLELLNHAWASSHSYP